MPDTDEQVQFREHLKEMRRAVGGLGRDFATEISTIDEKIDRLGKLTSKDAKYAMEDIRDDFTALSRSIDHELHALPHQVGSAVSRAGGAIGSASSRFANATGDAIESAGARAVEGTKNAAARIAGVRRTPMKQWHSPGNEPESPP
ncbi:MAG: hypothetical protein L3K18_03765 [Thermoplasmata archaeon]|nr:hypothetical protein [Thermoplasmata archaeon]MCI4356247.1 hypothetical protein [Thermoplasmata archaeon]